MKAAQLLFEHQRLVERERALRADIEQVESRLVSDPEVVNIEEALAAAVAAQEAAAEQLRESDRLREAHRTDLKARERQLMSGRIRNPSELMQMSNEVNTMKSHFAEEEDAELQLMEQAEAADRHVAEVTERLGEARARSAAEEPELRENLDGWLTELAEVVAERDEVWSQVPPAAQADYSRLRVHPPVAEVVNNQCSVCRVGVTSSGMQVLRKGDELVHCDHCGRILVPA
ncbi:MAG TPA: C4-type zinc ribbon domain-containing protein [Patescibacteria group bacterium]|nr:C4-type zinc ribbon domain-containing protein [Patescibacteria group bacterium]